MGAGAALASATEDTERFTREDADRALQSASPRAACILRREVPSLDPYAIGKAGELGLAQLASFGLLPDFYRQGYSDPFDPYQSVAYLEDALSRGLARNWTPVLRGLC